MEIHSKTNTRVSNSRTLTVPLYYKGHSIPAGFKWDGMSIPRVATWFMPRFGEANLAGLVHDFLYSTESEHNNRKEADNLFYDILVDLNVSKWKAYIIYKSVRLFGKSSYKKGK